LWKIFDEIDKKGVEEETLENISGEMTKEL
jgi:hypothetical protein